MRHVSYPTALNIYARALRTASGNADLARRLANRIITDAEIDYDIAFSMLGMK